MPELENSNNYYVANCYLISNVLCVVIVELNAIYRKSSTLFMISVFCFLFCSFYTMTTRHNYSFVGDTALTLDESVSSVMLKCT